MLRSLFSQLNNLLCFRGLFSLRRIINGPNSFPTVINFLITDKCNLKCSICSAHSMLNKKGQLSLEEIRLFIKSISKYKPAVFFGGGEPFIRKDIFEIIDSVKENKLKCGIVTNGTLIDKYAVKRLFKSEPEIMIFSVHGDEISHDYKTGKKGAFAALCKAIKLCLKNRNKADILLNSVISPDNYRQMEDVILLGKRLGVDKVRFENLIFLSEQEYQGHLAACKHVLPDGYGEMTTYIKDIDLPQIGPEIQNEIIRLKQKYRGYIIFKPYMSAAEREKWFTKSFEFRRKCLFVERAVFVNPNGDIVPCQFFSDYVLGNIKTDDLAIVWKAEKRKYFSKMLSKQILPGCKRCCKL